MKHAGKLTITAIPGDSMLDLMNVAYALVKLARLAQVEFIGNGFSYVVLSTGICNIYATDNPVITNTVLVAQWEERQGQWVKL